VSTLLLRMSGHAGSRRGATRRGAQPRAARAAWLVPALIVALLLAAGEMGFSALREVANVPIKQVTVNGDFRFLDKARVEEIMLPHLGTGYFMVDLAGIRDDLKQLPMVHEVMIVGLDIGTSKVVAIVGEVRPTAVSRWSGSARSPRAA
jgi:hypothetical protein